MLFRAGLNTPMALRALRMPPVGSMPRSFSTSASRSSIRGWLWRKRAVRYPTYAIGALAFSTVTVLGGLLVYDSMTYHKVDVKDTIVPNLVEAPCGGPGKLPILPRIPKEEAKPPEDRKERLVVIGGGWATVSMLMKLDYDAYDVVVVSPNNYFLFTPLLPAVAVGTVGVRSIIESIRKLLSHIGGRFVQGAAVNIEFCDKFDQKTLQLTDRAAGLVAVEVISPEWDGDMDVQREPNARHMIYLPYDKLVVAPGSITNNRGVKGLENCARLKTMRDAQGLRKRLIENLEVASLPTTSPSDRERLLSFVVCGGGPTGVEVAAEIYDMLNEDAHKHFPPPLQQLARVHLIQSRNHILNTYSEKISEYAEERFRHENIDLVTNAHVVEVTPEKVVYSVKNSFTGEVEQREVPSGCTVWSTGIAKANFTKVLGDLLPDQGNPHALRVDTHLRVLGAPQGTVYAMGDASTVDNDLEGFMRANFNRFDSDQDGELTVSEFGNFVSKLRHRFPLASRHLSNIDGLFEKYDLNHDHKICVSELANLVRDAAKDVTSFPPTAQVASQEGKYLGRKLNALAKLRSEKRLPQPDPKNQALFDLDDEVFKPYEFHSLGNVAYLGNAAAFDLPLPEPFHTFFGGLAVMYAWRSVYLSELVSIRTRVLVLGDFIKRSLWGRDLTWT
ncbi:hypothetical protein MOBT1_000897 [Malassezia obtusa]|uniref:EF-hand domain-containing protein n=1 Tax=Malassezia obtusa TaxID=76774 RepID=A0AAF0DZ00_9BASI|nr:hypothetical protein MOBT1_000897 [Malassezia obtusa]